MEWTNWISELFKHEILFVIYSTNANEMEKERDKIQIDSVFVLRVKSLLVSTLIVCTLFFPHSQQLVCKFVIIQI